MYIFRTENFSWTIQLKRNHEIDKMFLDVGDITISYFQEF